MSNDKMEKLTEKFTKLYVKDINKVIKIQRRYKIYLSNKNILSLNNWKKEYINIIKNYKESQYDFYKRNNACLFIF